MQRLAWEAHHWRRRDHTLAELTAMAAKMGGVHSELLLEVVLPNIAEGRLPLFQVDRGNDVHDRSVRSIKTVRFTQARRLLNRRTCAR